MSTAELTQRLNRLEMLLIELKTNVESEDVPPYLSHCDMECLLRCKKTFIYTLMDQGILPRPYKLMGKNLWKRSEVLSAIEKAMGMNQE